MENKSINRYNTFCKSLKNLEKSRYADPSADFVLEEPFLISVSLRHCLESHERYSGEKYGNSGFCHRFSRERLQQVFTNRLIDDDTEMQMLKTRNQLAHDYDGSFASRIRDIINVYYPLFLHFQKSCRNLFADISIFLKRFSQKDLTIH